MKSIKFLFMFLIALTFSNPVFSSAEVRKEYYPSGKLKRDGNFENGKLGMEGKYVNGKKEGIYKHYYGNGRIAVIDTFKKGQKTNRKVYDENGKLVKE